MASKTASRSLLSRFEGCICGALLGDCIGARFEHFWQAVPVQRIVEYVQDIKSKVDEEEFKEGTILYTDDTCMTFDLGFSLVTEKKFVPMDVGRRFTLTYDASSPQRFYGGNVTKVFHQLKQSNFTCDPWEPAHKQFNGSGSYGNGSAMRVSPVPLFAFKDMKEVINLASLQSKLTHTHRDGVNGAILQSLAIHKAINSGTIEDKIKFCDELKQQLRAECGKNVYDDKLDNVMKLLASKNKVKAKQINDKIGTDVTALCAVPAAIFFFLYTLEDKIIPEISEYNGLLRATIFAAAVSEDSDTVGSMAGAIAGAYYGMECMPDWLMKACEGSKDARDLANKLYEIGAK